MKGLNEWIERLVVGWATRKSEELRKKWRHVFINERLCVEKESENLCSIYMAIVAAFEEQKKWMEVSASECSLHSKSLSYPMVINQCNNAYEVRGDGRSVQWKSLTASIMNYCRIEPTQRVKY
jgi:hypothetical protein